MLDNKESVHTYEIQLVIDIILNWKWVTDQFAQKIYSPTQNNIGGNIGDGLNFVACSQGFTHEPTVNSVLLFFAVLAKFCIA